jgi:nicotinamide-nucleotide amidase
MLTEIISIGSELTSGQNLDTNSQWLSQRLAEVGIAVHWHTTLADDLAENVSAFRVARDRADLVIITGGLGPTQDDLTREALAQLAGVELVLDEPTLEWLKQLFASRKRPMPERNRVQAMFPAGSTPIPNGRGTAPGIWLGLPPPRSQRGEEGGGVLFIALPGVPSEMYPMFESEVKPRLAKLGPGGIIVEKKLNCFGAGESHLEEKVKDFTARGQVPEVGITVSDATVSLRIRARAADEAAAQALIAPVEQTIRERLGDLVFGEGADDLQHVVARLLAEQNLTIGTAESLTGGEVAQRLTQIPGISAHFLGGIVAYDNRIKHEQLGVPEELLQKHGAVSTPVAEAMALGCRTRLCVDLAVSTTGIAGPTGATPTKPVGLVYVGIADAKGVRSFSYNWFGTRHEIQSRSAKMALNIVRLRLIGRI